MRCVIKLVNSEEVGAQLHGALGSQGAPSLSFHPQGEGAEGFMHQLHEAMEGCSQSFNSQHLYPVPADSRQALRHRGTSADTWHLGREVVRADGTRRPCQHLLCTLPKFCLSFRNGHN